MRQRRGTGSWYTEQGTYTEPSSIPGMVNLMRAGKLLALVPEEPDQTNVQELQDAADEEDAAEAGEL